MTAFNRQAYFQRLDYTGPTAPDLTTLKALHRAQLYTLPFENFDILTGRGVDLDPDALFHKLVHHRRGGYCFELGALFGAALEDLGFDTRPLLGRVHRHGQITGRSHRLELVTLDDQYWIADVGHGADTPRAPLQLVHRQPVSHDGQTLRIIQDPVFEHCLQIRKDGEWTTLYSFDLTHVLPGDLTYANYYTATHPESVFTFMRMAALPLPGGRITLLEETLTLTDADGQRTLTLDNPEALARALEAHLGIVLDTPEALPPLPPAP